MTFELLEKRLAPAGLVVATVSNGVLTLTGDAADNGLTLAEFAPDQFRITGLEGTMIRYNGTDHAEVEIAGTGKGISANLAGGDDALTLQGVSLTGNLALQMGAGHNTLELADAVTIGGRFSYTGAGHADILSSGGTLEVLGETLLNLGGGDNRVTLGGGEVLLQRGLTINAGSGEDNVRLDARSVFVSGNVNLNLGGEGNLLSARAGSIQVTGSFTLINGAHQGDIAGMILHADSLDIGGDFTVRNGLGQGTAEVWVEDGITIGGSVTFQNSAGGTSYAGMSASSIQVGGSLSMLNQGRSVHAFECKVEIIADDVNVGGNLSIASGNGRTITNLGTLDGDWIAGTLRVGGSLSVSHGSNDEGPHSTTGIRFSLIDIGDRLSIAAGNGLYSHAVHALQLEAGGGIFVTNGNTVPRDGESVTHTSINGDDLSTASVSIINGTGVFTNYLNATNGSISGDVTIRSGAGGAVAAISGSLQIGGDVTLKCGSGVFAVDLFAGPGPDISVGGDFFIHQTGRGLTEADTSYAQFYLDESGLSVGGDLRIDFAHAALQTSVRGERLSVGDDFSIIQGNTTEGELSRTTITLNEKLRIGGDLTLRGGSGTGFEEIISAPLVSIGGNLSVTHLRNAVSTLSLTGDRFAVGGSLTFSNAQGGNSMLSMTGGDYSFGRGFSITSAAGDDALAVDVNSLRITGNFNAQFGQGGTESGIQVRGAAGLNLRGNFNLSAGAGSDNFGLAASGQITGSVTAAFGAGESSYFGLDGIGAGSDTGSLTIAGPVTLTVAAATSQSLSLSALNLRSAFSFTGGNSAYDGVTVFNSHFAAGITLNLRGGDNGLSFEGNTVRGAFTYVGGSGRDFVQTGSTSDLPGHFLGSVNIRLEGGDDTLEVGGTTEVYFHQRASFDGGAGADELIMPADGPVMPTFLAGPPTITNFESPAT